MADLATDLAALDRVIHEPARLAILTALGAGKRANFLSLQRLTALTDGNLFSHLSKLEEAGLVQVDKHSSAKSQRRRSRSPRTGARRLTAIGSNWPVSARTPNPGSRRARTAA